MLPEDESYDLAHFEFVMRGAARLIERRPMLRDYVSVSLHCELADILNAYTRIVRDDPSLTGLAAYSAARPAPRGGLAVWIAAYLANEGRLPRISTCCIYRRARRWRRPSPCSAYSLTSTSAAR
jgi:allantoinase